MDDIIEQIVRELIGCVFRSTVVSIILYANDILLLAPSIDPLQILFSMCECELGSLDLNINVKKSLCTKLQFTLLCKLIATIFVLYFFLCVANL